MSYRNPQQHIDKQSGQHIRNMQTNLSNTVSKLATEHKAGKEKKAREAEAKRAADLKEMDRLTGIQTTRTVNAGTKLNAAFSDNNLWGAENNYVLGDIANEIGRLSTQTTLSPEQQIYLTNANGLAETARNDIGVMTAYVESLQKTNSLAGKQGGFVKDQDPDGLTWVMGMANSLPGKRWYTVDNSQAGGSQLTYHFQKEGGGKTVSFSTRDLKEMQVAGTQPARIIPNQHAALTDVIKGSEVYKVVNGKITKELKDDYYENSVLEESESFVKNGKTYVNRFKRIDRVAMKVSLLAKSKEAVAAMDTNDKISFNNFLNQEMGIKESVDLKYGEEITPEQLEALEKNYADFAFDQNIVTNPRAVDTVLVEGPKGESSGNPYMNKHKDQLSTINNWSVDKKSKTQAVRLQDNSKGNEDTKALPYYIKFDPKTNQTYIHTEKGAVDDRTSGAKVTKKEAFDRFGLTIEDSFEEQDKSSSKAKEAKSDNWEDDNPVSSVESTENRAARKAKDLKQTSKISGSDWNKIPGVKK